MRARSRVPGRPRRSSRAVPRLAASPPAARRAHSVPRCARRCRSGGEGPRSAMRWQPVAVARRTHGRTVSRRERRQARSTSSAAAAGSATTGSSSSSALVANASRPSSSDRRWPSRTPPVIDVSSDRDRCPNCVGMLPYCGDQRWPLGEKLGELRTRATTAAQAASWAAFLAGRLTILDPPGHRRRVLPPAGRLEQLDRFERAPDVPGAVDVTQRLDLGQWDVGEELRAVEQRLEQGLAALVVIVDQLRARRRRERSPGPRRVHHAAHRATMR